MSRLDYGKISPGASRAMHALEGYIENSGIEERLVHLAKLRASQVNGCAYCIDMHSKDLMAIGESAQRIYSLSAGRSLLSTLPERGLRSNGQRL